MVGSINPYQLFLIYHELVGAEYSDHAVASRNKERGDLGEAVDVVRPAMKQHDHGSVRWPEVDVAHVQIARVDLLDRPEGRQGTARISSRRSARSPRAAPPCAARPA